MSSKYTFEVVLMRSVFPETTRVEVTAYHSDSPGDHELIVLCPKLPTADSQEVVYTATMEVKSLKPLLGAECRVDGVDTLISMPGFATSTDNPLKLTLGVKSIETSLEQDTSAADDEGVDLVTTADHPPAAIDAVDAEQKNSDGAGVAGPLAALKSLSQMGTAHSSCADLTLSDLKDVSEHADNQADSANVPSDEESAPAENQEPTEVSEQPELDAEVEGDSVSISELIEAGTADDVDSGAEVLSEASSELECVELQELVGDSDIAPIPTDDIQSTTERDIEVPALEEPVAEVAIEQAIAEKSTEATVEDLVADEPSVEAPIETSLAEHIEEPAVADPVTESSEPAVEEPATEVVESTVDTADAVVEEPADVDIAPVSEEPVLEAAETASDEPAVEVTETVVDDASNEEPIAEAVVDELAPKVSEVVVEASATNAIEPVTEEREVEEPVAEEPATDNVEATTEDADRALEEPAGDDVEATTETTDPVEKALIVNEADINEPVIDVSSVEAVDLPVEAEEPIPEVINDEGVVEEKASEAVEESAAKTVTETVADEVTADVAEEAAADAVEKPTAETVADESADVVAEAVADESADVVAEAVAEEAAADVVEEPTAETVADESAD
ncbi:hypothetical protein H4S04_008885, partial [Coemansia sp. S16]